MGLRETILEQMKIAMKNKDSMRLETLRFLQSAIKNKEIELRPQSITDTDIVLVIQKSVKQRKESIEQYLAGGRMDLADKERAELQILEEFLPQPLSAQQIEAMVEQAIQETGANGPKDLGVIIKTVIAKAQAGSIDNRLVSEIAKAKLQK